VGFRQIMTIEKGFRGIPFLIVSFITFLFSGILFFFLFELVCKVYDLGDA